MKNVKFLLLYLLICCSPLVSTPFIYYDEIWNTGVNDFSYFGLRPKMADYGLYLTSNITFDFNWPALGGIQTRNFPVHQYLYAFQFGVKTKKLFNLEGGHFLIAFLYHQTEHPSIKYVGDWQGFDNISAPNLTQLSQLWYEQELFNQSVAVRFGKIDAYTLFNFTEFAQTLLNNSFSQNPTILAFPTYPIEAIGVVLEYYPYRFLSIRTSIFDGSSVLGIDTGEKGARRFFTHLGQHALLLNEVQFEWGALADHFTGKLGLGFWGLTAKLSNFQGGETQGTTGFFTYLSQTLYKESPFCKKSDHKNLREIGAFAQFGVCGKEVVQIKEYFGCGCTFSNLVKHREDALSLGMATVLFSNATGAYYPKHFEMSLEITYQYNVLDYLSIQPDFQYIIHPGGQGLRNAIVGTLRLVASM